MSGREGFAGVARVGGRRRLAPARVALGARPIPQSWDLLAAPLLALLAVLLVRVEAPVALRTAFGLPLVLFLPGYALGSALFPSRDGPDNVERIAFGFALSLAVMPPLALILNGSPWGVATEPAALSLALITAVAALVGAVRRGRLPELDRYAPAIVRPHLPSPRSWDLATRLTTGIAILAIGLIAIGGAPIVLARLGGDPLTEFSLTNAAGRPGFFERDLVVGDPTEVRLGVVNREGAAVTYRIEVSGAGTALDPIPPIELAGGERWDGQVRFAATRPGAGLPVVFELHRVDRPPDAPPYRTVQLVVDATAPGA